MLNNPVFITLATDGLRTNQNLKEHKKEKRKVQKVRLMSFKLQANGKEEPQREPHEVWQAYQPQLNKGTKMPPVYLICKKSTLYVTDRVKCYVGIQFDLL